MTAPDHRLYLRPGVDLITAEDVAAWLRGPAWHTPPPLDRVRVEYVSAALDARLDRERRQACRRGARRAFADAATLMRCYALEQRCCGVVRDTGAEYGIEHYLTRALAFRAAARQP